MSVTSSIFKKVAEKISNPDEAARVLSEALNADPTRTESEVRAAQAEALADKGAAATLLLKGLKSDADAFGRILVRMGIPLDISTNFNAVGAFKGPSTEVTLSHQGRTLASFKASRTDDGYYVEAEENGGFLSMMNNHPVASFAEVEAEIGNTLARSLGIPAKDASAALRNMGLAAKR